MGAAILLMADQQGNITGQVIVVASIILILILTLVSMLLAGKIQHWPGVTEMHVITRVMGVLLSALAVQSVFDGIRQSGLVGA